MAPTEVLAERHGLSVRHVLGGLSVPDEATLTGDRPLRVEMLTNRMPAGSGRGSSPGWPTAPSTC